MKIDLHSPLGWVIVAAAVCGVAASVITVYRFVKQQKVKEFLTGGVLEPESTINPLPNAAYQAATVPPIQQRMAERDVA